VTRLGRGNRLIQIIGRRATAAETGGVDERRNDAMSLHKIRLELARTPEFPEGSADCGYEFIAPLDRAGHLDSRAWSRDKEKCTVRRFWLRENDEHGRLRHHPGGVWAFSYRGEESEEPIFRLDKHVFQTGAYVSVTEHDGIARPFKVVDVEATR
jgi:hypothetical protein